MKHKLKYLFIFFGLIFLGGCCPKITPSETIVIRHDTITKFLPDTVIVPAASQTFDFNFSKLCDSLSALKMSPNTAVDTHFTQKKNKTSIDISVDKNGKGKITCAEDSLKLIIDSLRQITTIAVDTTRTKTLVVEKCTSKFHQWAVYWSIFSITAFGVYLFIKLKPGIKI